MKILVFSRSVWDTTNAVGNTFSNWFDGKAWSSDSFYSIYMRNSMPQNDVCKDYYRITIGSILKNFLTPSKIGFRFQLDSDYLKIDSSSEEKAIVGLHKKPSNIKYFLMEKLLNSATWNNKRFRDYLKQIDPDIFFATAADDGVLKRIVETVKTNTKAKVVLYIADDVYNKYLKLPKYRGRMLTKNFEWLMKNADYLYGASTDLCNAYHVLFNVPVNVIYKGCLFCPLKKDRIVSKKQKRIIYAGNLKYGRLSILIEFALRLMAFNDKNDTSFVLEVYTGDIWDEKSIDGITSIKMMGKRPYHEIRNIMSDSDFSLHVESFDEKQIEYVHYSFSTKIIDCLQSGSGLIAIGPSELSSIKYLKGIPGCLVCDKLDKLDDLIENIYSLDYKKSILQIRDYALEHHNLEIIQSDIRESFCSLIK